MRTRQQTLVNMQSGSRIFVIFQLIYLTIAVSQVLRSGQVPPHIRYFENQAH